MITTVVVNKAGNNNIIPALFIYGLQELFVDSSVGSDYAVAVEKIYTPPKSVTVPFELVMKRIRSVLR